MSERRTIDVSRLPTHAFGARDPLWWAIVLVIAIEGSMFALLLVSYFYIRSNFADWPPAGVGTWDLWLGNLTAFLIFAMTPTVAMTNRAALRRDVNGMRRWLLACTLLVVAATVARFVELSQLPFRWDSHAYGSVVWTIYGVHTFHLVATVVESALLLGVLLRGPIEAKFPVDVHVSGLYTYFVIASWLPFFLVLALERSVWP